MACTCFWPPSVALSAVLSADADCAFLSTCGFFWPCGSSKCTFISHFTLCSCVGGRKTKIKIGRFGDSEQLAPCTQLRITRWSSALLFFFLFWISPILDNNHSDIVARQLLRWYDLEMTFIWIENKTLPAQCSCYCFEYLDRSFIHAFIHSCIHLTRLVLFISTLNFSVDTSITGICSMKKVLVLAGASVLIKYPSVLQYLHVYCSVCRCKRR